MRIINVINVHFGVIAIVIEVAIFSVFLVAIAQIIVTTIAWGSSVEGFQRVITFIISLSLEA